MVSSGSATAASSSSSGTPRTRQRVHKTPPPLDVPDIDEDAAERKRILNVLAQRRYRERKRQDRLKARGQRKKDGSQETQSQESEPPNAAVPVDEEVEAAENAHTTRAAPSHSLPPTEDGVALMDIESINWDGVDISDLSSFLPESLPQSPELMTGQTTAKDAFPVPAFLPNVNDVVFSSQFSSPVSFNSSPSVASSDFDFPDSYLLPVHELTLLKALMRISDRLGCESSQLWSLECLSPFNQGLGTPIDQLPASWRPTASQLSIPHHPVVDFLPWPSARDRILMFMALPDEARPPVAQGPMALVNFVYDLEHNAEGVRIYGSDPCDPGSWEVGQVFFERWWFLFDREIIDNSNHWRELRGAPPLLLKGQ